MGGLLFNTIVTVSTVRGTKSLSIKRIYEVVYLFELFLYSILKNSYVVWKFLPEPVQIFYFNIVGHNFAYAKKSSRILNETEFLSEK